MKDEKFFRILYFSGTGNTEYVARKIEGGLVANGLNVKSMAADRLWADCGMGPGKRTDKNAVSKKLSDFLKDANLLLLAFPTHDSNVPEPVSDLFPLLPEGDGMNLAVVSTIYLAGGDCCICLRCYNFCPRNAIQVTDRTRDQKKFPRYKGFDDWKPPRLRKI